MTDMKTTQVGVETFAVGPSDVRVTQVGVEVWGTVENTPIVPPQCGAVLLIPL